MSPNLIKKKLSSGFKSLKANYVDGFGDSMDGLLKKVVENEKILSRHQRFELKLLDAIDFESLLDLLLVKSVEYFRLDAVELWLFDPEKTLSELLTDELALKNLHLVSSSQMISHF